MDFHSLLRRDLQFLCKRNRIPANMTNVAMADALKSLEFVEGLDEYLKQSDPNAPQSPTSIAKQPPKTATRTTRGKTTTKAEPQSSSRSCRLTSKSLAGEMDQENINKNVTHEPKTSNVKFEANVPKTPAARSTRKASAATSCSSKVQESKKGELVQSVYNTRRSTRLLEKSMADLSLKTKETLDNKPANNEDTEQKVSAQGKNPDGSEPEVILGRNLSVSMEEVCDNSKNDKDLVVGGDIAVMDANTETHKEEMNEVTGDEKESENGVVQVDKLEETLQSICEEGPKKNDNDQEQVWENLMNENDQVVGGDIAVMDANTETNMEKMNEVMDAYTETNKEVMSEDTGDEKESKNGVVQVDKVEETLQGICKEGPKKNDNDQEQVRENLKNVNDQVAGGDIAVIDANTETNTEKMNEVMGDEKESENVLVQVDKLEETLQAICEEGPKKNDNGDLEVHVDLVDIPVLGYASTEALVQVDKQEETLQAIYEEQEETLQAIYEEAPKKNDNDQETGDLEVHVDLVDIPVLGYASTEAHNDNKEYQNALAFDSLVQVDQQETEETIQENDSELVKMNNDDEEDNKIESDAGDSIKDNSGVDSDGTISEADSNQAVQGSDIADEEMILSESEGSVAAPTSPPLLEETEAKATPLSPFAAGSISVQFPRPSKPKTPFKNSAMKLDNIENKENSMEMMNVNKNENGESIGEEAKKKKVTTIDEKNLKDASMRQLVKMVKELSIKSSNRTALQILPGNNQTAE